MLKSATKFTWLIAKKVSNSFKFGRFRMKTVGVAFAYGSVLRKYLIWLNVNENGKKMPKIQNLWNFTMCETCLVETIPRSMLGYWGVNLLCTFRRGVVVKIPNLKFWKKESGDVLDRHLSTNFGVNLLNWFRQNGFYRRTPNGRTLAPWQEYSSAVA